MIRSNYKYLAILAGFLLSVFQGYTADGVESNYRILVEPSFAYPPLSWPIAGAKQTLLVPARIEGGMPKYLSTKDFLQKGLSRDLFEKAALEDASQLLSRLKPTLIRNDEGVILYAVLESTDPSTASVVLAPNFSKMFEDTIGPDFLVAIPNRFRIYIFPRLFAPMAKIADDVAIDFRSSAYPVTKEVFALHKGRLSCVGLLE